jgi:predicted Zn-dependent peptidase
MVKDPKYKLTKLKNGLKIVTCDMNYIDTISIHIIVGVGSWYGTPNNNNYAHYVEHIVASEIIENIVSKEILLYNYNASTYNEKTEYYINTVNSDFNLVLNKVLNIFYRVLNNYKINKKIFERERGIIIQEHVNDLLDDDNNILEGLLKFIFPKSYLIASDNDNIKITKKVKIEILEKFIKEYYIPNNIIISIAGNLKNESKIIKTIKNKFDKINFQEIPKLKEIPLKHNFKLNNLKFPKFQSESKIIITFYLEDVKLLTEKERFTLDIITRLINLPIGHTEIFSLTYQLRTEEKIVYNVDVSASLNKYSVFMISTEGIKNNNLKKALNVIFSVIKYFKKNKINKDKLKKYIYDQSKLDESYSKRFINSSFYADYYANLVFHDEKNYLGKDLTYLKKVTTDDIKDFCNKYFTEERCKIFIIGNEKINYKPNF